MEIHHLRTSGTRGMSVGGAGRDERGFSEPMPGATKWEVQGIERVFAKPGGDFGTGCVSSVFEDPKKWE